MKPEELREIAERRLAREIAAAGDEPSERHVAMCTQKPSELIAEMANENVTVQEWLAIIAVIGDLILQFIKARRGIPTA